METSVLTLTRNRTDHLVHQIRGLLQQRRPPDEHVVAVMGGDDPRGVVPETPWPTRFVDVDPGPASLPLAEARNAAAAAATGEALILLDVDCVPSPTLVDSYADGLAERDAILMGGVSYLPPGAMEDVPDADVLHRRGARHPSRPEPPVNGSRTTDRYELFWSLSFAVRGSTFDRLGGFDEAFVGYGAEDTDFAFRARARGVPLAWHGAAWAYHQHHDTYDPPLQHLRAIVPNAHRFRAVWGSWPMEGWLARFAELGLIAWEPEGDHLEVLRDPTDEELASAHRATAVPSA